MSNSQIFKVDTYHPMEYNKEARRGIKTLEKLSYDFIKAYGQYELLNELDLVEQPSELEEAIQAPAEQIIQDCHNRCTEVLTSQDEYISLETLIQTEEFVKQTTDSLKDYITGQTNSLKNQINQAQNTLKNAGIDANTGLLRQEKAYEAFRDTYLNLAMSVINTGKTGHLGVVFADLDNLKHHNALYGHPAMDKVIAEMGKTIQGSVKQKKDAAIRKGGDEFVIYVTSFEETGPETYVNKLHDAIHQIKIDLSCQQTDGLYTPTATCGYDTLTLTYQEARAIETTLLEYNHKLKQAKPNDRDAILTERTERLDEQIKPLFQESIEHANDAVYDAKIQGKDRIEPFSSTKEKIGYYDNIRTLYNQIVRNEIKPRQAQHKANQYLSSFNR